MNAAAGAGAASAAAAAERRRQMEEEEEMTGYRADELAQDYEFKILRSTMGAFKRPERLQQVLEEEARAGWVLVEKFDDSRLRLKRPTAARERDGKLGIDAYRTYIGPSPNAIALIVVAAVLAVMLTFGLMLALRSARGIPPPPAVAQEAVQRQHPSSTHAICAA
jgi:hypothetical protein